MERADAEREKQNRRKCGAQTGGKEEKMSLFVKLRSFSTAQQITFVRNTHSKSLASTCYYHFQAHNNLGLHILSRSLFTLVREIEKQCSAFCEFSVIIYQNVEIWTMVQRTRSRFNGEETQKTGEAKIVSNKICLCCSYCDAKIVISV